MLLFQSDERSQIVFFQIPFDEIHKVYDLKAVVVHYGKRSVPMIQAHRLKVIA